MIDNEHILKFMDKVEELIMINRKQESLIAVFYTGMLYKGLAGWQGLPQEHKILTYLIRELVITCFKSLTPDHNHSIIQMIENINKIKNNFIKNKVIIAK